MASYHLEKRSQHTKFGGVRRDHSPIDALLLGIGRE
jgi:hypothetical protein